MTKMPITRPLAPGPIAPAGLLPARVQKLIKFCGVREKAGVRLPFTSVDPRYLGAFCHLNVKDYVDRHKGERVHGWVVWDYPAVKVAQAEFHSVWRNPAGELLDITPHRAGEPEILFFADTRNKIVWDGSQNELPATRTTEGGLGYQHGGIRMPHPSTEKLTLNQATKAVFHSLGRPDYSLA